MLKKIPKIISPELMKTLMEMGHSDVIILADANYPAAANAKRLLRADGVEIPDLLSAILEFFPLDSFVPNPVKLMDHLRSEETPKIWSKYEEIIKAYDDENAFCQFDFVDRHLFYEESGKAYAIVTTATTARYANIVLQKGVI